MITYPSRRCIDARDPLTDMLVLWHLHNVCVCGELHLSIVSQNMHLHARRRRPPRLTQILRLHLQLSTKQRSEVETSGQ